MNVISFTILLEYLYKKFVVTFILSLIGAFIKETFKTTKMKKMEPKKMLASAAFSSVLICAFVDYMTIPFGIYVAVTIIVGMWGYQILSVVLNANFMKKFVYNFFKNSSNAIAKSVSETMENTEEEKKKRKNTRKRITTSKEDENNNASEGQ